MELLVRENFLAIEEDSYVTAEVIPRLGCRQ